jgi:peptide chain release factor 2
MIEIENHTAELEALHAHLEQIQGYLHIDAKRDEIGELELLAAAPGFWDDNERALNVSKRTADLRAEVKDFDDAAAICEDALVANELALGTGDEQMATEVVSAVAALGTRIENLELSSWFDGEFDSGDAIVSINPGQGGLEAQDWADMLFRMYTYYVGRRGWKIDVLDAPAAEGIGIDHATFIVSGRDAYGMLRAEQGVHRLVRISPTDVKQRRQTTFAGVEVLPVLPDDIEVKINESDVRIDVFHSSGAGGQSVNTSDSAVRLTHMPTGIVVTCQNERSQLQNKEVAFKILNAKLYELEKEKRAAELDEIRGERHEASWGNQIRNYVLYPYQLVKDLRSGVETGNVDAVLGGDLDAFVIGYHRWRVANS